MSHTKGPWIGTQPSCGFAEIKDANGDLIMAVCYPSLGMKDKCRPVEETDANYRAMIATPDLLEALERLVNWHGVIYSVPVGAKDPFTEARAAIKKARGE